MPVNWLYAEVHERVVAGKVRKEAYYGVTCDRCLAHRWLRKTDARRVEQHGCICRNCAQAQKAPLGYAATAAKYGMNFALNFVRGYRLANPSCLELDVMAALDELGVRYEREVRVSRYLVDFMVDQHFAIEVNGTYVHGKRDRLRERARCLTIENAGYRLLVIDEPDVPEAVPLIARFLNLETVAC